MSAQILTLLLLEYLVLVRGHRPVASDIEASYSDMDVEKIWAKLEELIDKLQKVGSSPTTDVSYLDQSSEAGVKVAAEKLLEKLAGAGLSKENIVAVTLNAGEDHQRLGAVLEEELCVPPLCVLTLVNSDRQQTEPKESSA